VLDTQQESCCLDDYANELFPLFPGNVQGFRASRGQRVALRERPQSRLGRQSVWGRGQEGLPGDTPAKLEPGKAHPEAARLRGFSTRTERVEAPPADAPPPLPLPAQTGTSCGVVGAHELRGRCPLLHHCCQSSPTPQKLTLFRFPVNEPGLFV
jgi:hypothetical protein